MAGILQRRKARYAYLQFLINIRILVLLSVNVECETRSNPNSMLILVQFALNLEQKLMEKLGNPKIN